MSLFRFDTIIPSQTGLPEDAVVNTWHFNNPAQPLPPSDFDNVRDMLANFFTVEAPDAAARLSSFYTTASVSGPVVVRAYNLDDAIPRAPVYESEFTFTGLGSAAALPTEVALVLSIQATPQSGMPQARRRNRKYLGPFGVTGNENPGRPSEPLRRTVAAAAKQLLLEAQASASWGWRVHSPTNNADYEPVGGWVDNAWDTQRRRGLGSTTRTLWSEDLPSS